MSEEMEKEFEIYEEKTWRDDKSGMVVIENIPLQTPSTGKLELVEEKPVVRYGKAHVPTQMGPMPFKFKFPEEFDLMDCFKRFEECAQAALDQMEKEASEQIIIPEGINPADLKA